MVQTFCCPNVEHAIENRHSPLEWNADLETCTLSYHDSGGYSILRYCPYCGQAFPFVAAITRTIAETQEETTRILQEIGGLRTLAELTDRLGPPSLSLTLHPDDESSADDQPIRRHRFYVCDGKLEILAREFRSGRINTSVAPVLRKGTSHDQDPE